MKKLLILPLLLAFQIVSAQWNAIGWNPFTLRSTSGDSTFVLSAPSRVDLQKGTASWVPERQASYKVYTALLTQTGTDAPVATVLENTLGGTVVWSYEDVGVYKGTLIGAFTANKTFFPQKSYILLNDGDTQVTVGYNSLSTNDVSIFVHDLLVDPAELNTTISFEIRVYP